MVSKKSGLWKIKLTITNNFFSSNNDNDEERVMIQIVIT